MFYGRQVGTLHGYVGPHRRGQIKQNMRRQVVPKAETEANIWAAIGDITGSLALTTGSH